MPPRILQLSIKPRTPGQPGLPKHAVPELRVSAEGAEGDYNHYRATRIAGDPDQAILFMTEETLARLRTEGWPVRPGDLGENVTLDQVPESRLAPGVQVQLGEALLEITKPCDPCTELHSLAYVGAERGARFVKTMVGRRGWYARVLAPGLLTLTSPVSISQVPAARPSKG